MKILWLTWKDRKNPFAGGAETVNEELAKRLVQDGHEVVFLVGGFREASQEETVNGFRIIRVGNWKSVYWKAYRYYKNNLEGKFDLVIDEMNTLPFFAKFYAREKNILFVHQLCREIWFYQMPFPLSLIGYLLEPIYLWLLRDRQVITVSESTRKDLIRFGFKKKNIKIISEGIEIDPVADPQEVKKFHRYTVLGLGSLRPMKRTIHMVKAFEKAKEKLSGLQLILAGPNGTDYGKKVLKLIENSCFAKDIQYLGKVTEDAKRELMQKAHLLLVASVKEGWGLVVTEAGSQGTPAVVYDVDGLRDSVKHNETGYISRKNKPEYLAKGIVTLMRKKNKYERVRKNAYEWSKEINFDRSYEDFKKVIGKYE